MPTSSTRSAPASRGEPDRGPDVRVPPPLIFLIGFALSAALTALWPLAERWRHGTWRVPLAILFTAHGLGLAILAIATFRRAGTAVLPDHPASALVTTGIYARTRNPIYAGLTLIYLGGAALTASLWALLILPVVLTVLSRFVIAREERYLTQRFPVDYPTYCAEVGRWI